MATLTSVSGLSQDELAFEIQRGGRFVVYQYCISLLIITFKRNSPVKFIRAGESATVKGLPFTLLTLVLGWWAFPGDSSTPRRSSTRTSTAAPTSPPRPQPSAEATGHRSPRRLLTSKP